MNLPLIVGAVLLGGLTGAGSALAAGRSICAARVGEECRSPRMLVSRSRPDGRCARCARPVRPGMPMLEVVTALVFGGLVWRIGPSVVLPAYLLAAAVGIAVSVVDLRVNRIPNRLLGPGMAAVAAALCVAAVVEHAWWPLLRGAVAAAVVGVVFFVLALVRAMGGGDVKLAAGLALVLGWLGWPAVLVGLFLGFTYGAGLGLWFRIRRVRRFPLGPALVAGALTMILVAA